MEVELVSPIRGVSYEEGLRHAKNLKALIKRYYESHDDKHGRYEIVKNLLAGARNRDLTRPLFSGQGAYVYFDNDCPVGVMFYEGRTVNGKTKLWISEIFTHPAFQGIGSELIAKLSQVSKLLGQGGAVSLHAYDEKVKSVYEKMGFQQDSDAVDYNSEDESDNEDLTLTLH